MWPTYVVYGHQRNIACSRYIRSPSRSKFCTKTPIVNQSESITRTNKCTQQDYKLYISFQRVVHVLVPMHHPTSMYWCLNSFVSETSWRLCLGAEACISTLCTVCNPIKCVCCQMWFIVTKMNITSNIKPVGKIMLAFGNHQILADLSLDQVLVFTVTSCDCNKCIPCNYSLKHFYQTSLMLLGMQRNFQTNTPTHIFCPLGTF